MDVSEAPPRPHHILRRRSPLSYPWLLGTDRFLSRHRPRVTMKNVCRFTLCAGNQTSLKMAPILLEKKGNPNITCEGLCDIVWTVEAELEDGQLLYITGDPIVLGCWKPEMAVLMSPTEHANLWKAEIKIASGINFKYNYLIKGETSLECDIIWRPGPQFSLSVCAPFKHGRKITVRDSWMRFDSKKSLAPVWDSWIEEIYLPISSSVTAPAIDEFKIDKFLESDVVEPKPFLSDLAIELPSDPDSALHEGGNSVSISSERDQPVEEPWLFYSSIYFHVIKDKMESGELKNEHNEAMQFNLDNQHHYEVTEMFLPEEESVLVSDPVSTTILINSSICTMQRIALLEDGKFVELLLEPVKTNVQCDSVYLGVVTKLVPHMGGAFVNIGNTRPSLMDIKQSREPFIFPPFRQKKRKKEVNGSPSGAINENQETHGNEQTSFGDAAIIDGVTEIDTTHDDYDEHDLEDDFDVSEALKENLNGGIVDYGGEEADFEDYLDGNDQHLEGETVNGSFNLQMEGGNNFHISQIIDKKDSRLLCSEGNKWVQVQKGTKIVVQVVKEGLGTKGPTLTAYPKLKSRFWILISRCDRVGVSKKISGVERTRLKVIAKTLQPQGFGLTVRTVAAGHSLEDLQKDLEGLVSTWKNIMEHAKSAALAADEGVEGAIPVILHRAMGQTLSVVQDYFNEKVKRMVVDSPRTYHEVRNYLQEMAPDLCDRVELYNKRNPLFDEFNIEEEINNILSKRVPLAKGGSLVIEQTEALVSIDVNGGHGMFGHGNSQQKAILDVNLAAAKQIARELRLRDIGGIIVVDFIDMADESNKRLVYEEVKKAVEKDRSMVKVSELSRHGLMEITRKRVRPSVTFMISEPCDCCHATGRVEALETSFSKIEQEICRLLAIMNQRADPGNPKSWPKFILRVDHQMSHYLTSGRRTRLAILSSSLKVWIILKVARGFTRGAFEVEPFMDDRSGKDQQHGPISMLRSTEAKNGGAGKKVILFPVKKWKTGGK